MFTNHFGGGSLLKFMPCRHSAMWGKTAAVWLLKQKSNCSTQEVGSFLGTSEAAVIAGSRSLPIPDVWAFSSLARLPGNTFLFLFFLLRG